MTSGSDAAGAPDRVSVSLQSVTLGLSICHRRKFEPKTQSSYLRAVRNLAVFLAASPDAASAKDLRRFKLHMVEQGTSPITLNATISGLKFFLGQLADL